MVFEDNQAAAALYGENESTLRLIERAYTVDAHARGNQVRLIGAEEDVASARRVLEELYGQVQAGEPMKTGQVQQVIRMVGEKPDVSLDDVYEDVLAGAGSRTKIVAKTLAQKRYVEMMRKHDVVLSVGPAGTGKTYLAMAMAVAALGRREVSRVVLTRPAVEAGERLGFLPGDLAEKVNPYLRPLYDALHDMLDFGRANRLMERGVIEVAPLAFMRGRTLNDAFVILDEAQNTTTEQMKMFLTRLGFGSKCVVTGDVTQTDLGPDTRSGLTQALDVLSGVEGIGFMRFSDADVVRHPLVQSIIRAYDAASRREEERRHRRERTDDSAAAEESTPEEA